MIVLFDSFYFFSLSLRCEGIKTVLIFETLSDKISMD